MFWLVNWLISSYLIGVKMFDLGSIKTSFARKCWIRNRSFTRKSLIWQIPIFFFAFNKKITTSYTFVLLAQRTQFRCVKKQRALWFLYDPHWYLNICIICLPFFCMTNTNIILTCIWWYTMRCVWTRSEDKTLAYIAKIF